LDEIVLVSFLKQHILERHPIIHVHCVRLLSISPLDEGHDKTVVM